LGRNGGDAGRWSIVEHRQFTGKALVGTEPADTLATLMDDPEAREEFGEAGRARVGEHYNLPQNVARLGRIFAARLGGESC
ncbi:MAG: hypothetical protein NT123_20085, partial [Proteobacteria bacterium]|nr:hypothetical protein [Pseudomonadota bacterium]